MCLGFCRMGRGLFLWKNAVIHPEKRPMQPAVDTLNTIDWLFIEAVYIKMITSSNVIQEWFYDFCG